MPPKGTLESRLARLTELGELPMTAAVEHELLAALADGSNLVVARAAEVMGRSGQEAFLPHLMAAFDRLLRQPATADKTCRAKEAIVHALEALGCREAEPFQRGARHVQMEPVFGGKVDTATILRCDCALALARLRDPDAHFTLAALLTDLEAQPRQAAARALAFLGDEKSELLLRLKALTGDADPAVLEACFTGLLGIEPERSLAFVGQFLDENRPVIAEQAALALGESHLEGAFPLLRRCYEVSADLQFTRGLLLPMALTRSDAAVYFLLTVINDEGRGAALKAVAALAIYAADPRIRRRVHDAVTARKDEKVTEAYDELFGAEGAE